MSNNTGAVLDETPRRCPRRALRAASATRPAVSRWVTFADLHREPFRLFFPTATMAALIGIALWPLLLLGWTDAYPGPRHARLMVQGFFSGFIFGFMGTAMPRLLGTRPFSAGETLSLLLLFLGNIAICASGLIMAADILFAVEIAFLLGLLVNRWRSREELPPPTFVLVGLAFASALSGTLLSVAGHRWELSAPLELLARLLSYHGFVLLAVLGAGGFLLPRFLGLGARKIPEGPGMKAAWQRAARYHLAAGGLVLTTYVLEAFGWSRVAGTVRAIVIIGVFCREMPLHRLRWNWRGVHWQLLVGIACIPIGVLTAGWFPAMRATLLHLELVGGFALITFAVATRVVFGHSGAQARLDRFHPWLTIAAVLMLLGLTSRITGDFRPGIQTTHYVYGAFCWLTGTVVWAVCVLPRVLRPDPD
ncbi:MAG TPA: NnrS family protein [Verrucomicrobiae bacterium]|nr:NnrS family protein [Verrucomicrobiae bacterium]